MKQLPVQILVVVANIQMRTLKAENISNEPHFISGPLTGDIVQFASRNFTIGRVMYCGSFPGAFFLLSRPFIPSIQFVDAIFE
jgi:hypothetical protein